MNTEFTIDEHAILLALGCLCEQYFIQYRKRKGAKNIALSILEVVLKISIDMI